ncbi:hypothetical protein DRE_00169 [Drechslerella stenobrocha 248]|uniref:Uncharacterized protein n=1 Tax=Drechslerella stenobrocha 248 TaxID=1043628 RepID=W7HZC3_9PEZI|nr:hypothetical protein DRE_00169 [Drechslerella stenobrocha 248]
MVTENCNHGVTKGWSCEVCDNFVSSLRRPSQGLDFPELLIPPYLEPRALKAPPLIPMPRERGMPVNVLHQMGAWSRDYNRIRTLANKNGGLDSAVKSTTPGHRLGHHVMDKLRILSPLAKLRIVSPEKSQKTLDDGHKARKDNQSLAIAHGTMSSHNGEMESRDKLHKENVLAAGNEEYLGIQSYQNEESEMKPEEYQQRVEQQRRQKERLHQLHEEKVDRERAEKNREEQIREQLAMEEKEKERKGRLVEQRRRSIARRRQLNEDLSSKIPNHRGLGKHQTSLQRAPVSPSARKKTSTMTKSPISKPPRPTTILYVPSSARTPIRFPSRIPRRMDFSNQSAHKSTSRALPKSPVRPTIQPSTAAARDRCLAASTALARQRMAEKEAAKKKIEQDRQARLQAARDKVETERQRPPAATASLPSNPKERQIDRAKVSLKSNPYVPPTAKQRSRENPPPDLGLANATGKQD